MTPRSPGCHGAPPDSSPTHASVQIGYDALESKYQVAAARARARLTQDVVAQRMGTTKSAVSRLEGAGKHTPSVGTLQRYANAVGGELKIELVPKGG